MKHFNHYNYAGTTGFSGKHRARLQRDDEFIRAYRPVLDLMIEMGVPDARRAAVDFTVHHFQPRYHVSYERAYSVVCALLNGKQPVKPSLQAEMWMEIATRVRDLCAAAPGLSIGRATQWVIDNCRASRVFVTPGYAYDHIRHITPLKYN